MGYKGHTYIAEIVAGQDEGADDTITVAGIGTDDRVVYVVMLESGTVMGQIRHDFRAIAGEIQVMKNKRNTTGDKYLIVWENNTI